FAFLKSRPRGSKSISPSQRNSLTLQLPHFQQDTCGSTSAIYQPGHSNGRKASTLLKASVLHFVPHGPGSGPNRMQRHPPGCGTRPLPAFSWRSVAVGNLGSASRWVYERLFDFNNTSTCVSGKLPFRPLRTTGQRVPARLHRKCAEQFSLG